MSFYQSQNVCINNALSDGILGAFNTAPSVALFHTPTVHLFQNPQSLFQNDGLCRLPKSEGRLSRTRTQSSKHAMNHSESNITLF
jgi:hypothetical protein